MTKVEIHDLISLSIVRNDDGTHSLEEMHEAKGHKVKMVLPRMEHLQLHLGPVLSDDDIPKIVGYALIIAGNATPFNPEEHIMNWTVET